MKTILYIGNTYCSSIEELKIIIEKSPAQDSLLGKELLCALKDGTLERWLQEGEKEERLLANELPQIQMGSSDSDLLKKLGESFKSDYKTKVFNISDFIRLHEVKGCIGDTPSCILAINGGYIQCPKENSAEMSFNFNFIVDKTIGEKVVFRMRIKNDQNVIECSDPKDYHLKELDKSLYVNFSISYTEIKECVPSMVKIELVSVFMGNETVVWESTLSTYGEKQYLSIEREKTSMQTTTIDVYDSNGQIVKENLNTLKCGHDTIPYGYVIGSCKKDGLVYVVTNKGVQPICSWDIDLLNSLSLYHIEFVGNNCSTFWLRDEKGSEKHFIKQGGRCILKEEYLKNFCESNNLPYSLLNISKIGGKDAIYIGKKDGEALFLVNTLGQDAQIINANGDFKWRHGYNSHVSPTFDESLYIATNTGRKYSKLVFMSTDGLVVKSYNIRTRISPTILTETKTSITISSSERYLKKLNGGTLIDYLNVNDFFYIKKGVYEQNDWDPTICQPELYLTLNDQMVMCIHCSSSDFNNSYFEDLGYGYIAVRKEDAKNSIVILAPDGSVVYTLNKTESIYQGQGIRWVSYNDKVGFGVSEGAFIIKESRNNLYKIISYDGLEVCRFNTDENICLGFHAGKTVYYTNYEIGYYDDKGEKHKIPWSRRKNRYINSVKVLINGNVLINCDPNQEWVLIDTNGKELLTSKKNINII